MATLIEWAVDQSPLYDIGLYSIAPGPSCRFDDAARCWSTQEGFDPPPQPCYGGGQASLVTMILVLLDEVEKGHDGHRDCIPIVTYTSIQPRLRDGLVNYRGCDYLDFPPNGRQTHSGGVLPRG